MPPRVLLACSEQTFARWAGHPCVGSLLTPTGLCARRASSYWHPFTAFDNAAFSNWDEAAFWRLLLTHQRNSARAWWVACPDVVGDWRETTQHFRLWAPRVAKMGYRLAYVAQDGQPAEAVPWGDVECLFLGGTTGYKLSADALALCRRAKELGKLVHVGRVNSPTRLTRFLGAVDSFDGMCYSKYNRTHLPAMLRWLESLAG